MHIILNKRLQAGKYACRIFVYVKEGEGLSKAGELELTDEEYDLLKSALTNGALGYQDGELTVQFTETSTRHAFMAGSKPS